MCFQVLLALKFPLGKMAWGGKFTVLPQAFRIASAFSAVLLLFLTVCVLERGGIITIFNARAFVTVVVWLFTVFFALNTFMNLRSLSPRERQVMTPVAFTLFLSNLIVSITA